MIRPSNIWALCGNTFSRRGREKWTISPSFRPTSLERCKKKYIMYKCDNFVFFFYLGWRWVWWKNRIPTWQVCADSSIHKVFRMEESAHDSGSLIITLCDMRLGTLGWWLITRHMYHEDITVTNLTGHPFLKIVRVKVTAGMQQTEIVENRYIIYIP